MLLLHSDSEKISNSCMQLARPGDAVPCEYRLFRCHPYRLFRCHPYRLFRCHPASHPPIQPGLFLSLDVQTYAESQSGNSPDRPGFLRRSLFAANSNLVIWEICSRRHDSLTMLKIFRRLSADRIQHTQHTIRLRIARKPTARWPLSPFA